MAGWVCGLAAGSLRSDRGWPAVRAFDACDPPLGVARRDYSASTPGGQPDDPTVTHKGRPEGRPTPPPQQPQSGTAPPVRCARSGRRPTRQDGDHRNHPEATNRGEHPAAVPGSASGANPTVTTPARPPQQVDPTRQPALPRGGNTPRPRRPPHTHAMRGGPHPWAAREPRSVPSERGTKGFTPRPPKRGDPHAPRGHRHPKGAAGAPPARHETSGTRDTPGWR